MLRVGTYPPSLPPSLRLASTFGHLLHCRPSFPSPTSSRRSRRPRISRACERRRRRGMVGECSGHEEGVEKGMQSAREKGDRGLRGWKSAGGERIGDNPSPPSPLHPPHPPPPPPPSPSPITPTISRLRTTSHFIPFLSPVRDVLSGRTVFLLFPRLRRLCPSSAPISAWKRRLSPPNLFVFS